MKRTFCMVVPLLLSASFALAGATRQKWTAGWDIFNEPLNYEKSSVTWSVNPTTSKLTVTYKLVGATPNKLYGVALGFSCTNTFPATWAGFPTQGAGTCYSETRQGVTTSIAETQIGVVTTDINGNGSVTVVTDPAPAGTYQVEFYVYDGAYCAYLIPEGCSICFVDFQSPGPFGTWTTMTVP